MNCKQLPLKSSCYILVFATKVESVELGGPSFNCKVFKRMRDSLAHKIEHLDDQPSFNFGFSSELIKGRLIKNEGKAEKAELKIVIPSSQDWPLENQFDF